MLNRISILAASAAVMALATTGANATVFTSGSFAIDPGFVNLGGSSTNVTDVPLTIELSSSTVAIGSGTGNFAGIAGVTVNNLTLGSNPLVFTTADAADFNFSNALLGTFVASAVTESGAGCGSVGANAVCYSIFGSFTPGSSFTNDTSPVAGGADEIWTLNQVGGTGTTISISATANSPAVTVPEPLTISLFGAGLAGLGFGARRRKAAAQKA
jgi:hypothetical protein